MEEAVLLSKVIVHQVGNRSANELNFYSKDEVNLSLSDKFYLQQTLLERFKGNEEYYQFSHSTSLEFNEIYQYVSSLFQNAESFTSQSVKIAEHLFSQSTHPRIKKGDLYIVYFEALPLHGKNYKAAGIFKSENKTTFLNLSLHHEEIKIDLLDGLDPLKFDKGCLIFNNDAPEGFHVLVYDRNTQGEEAIYWKEKFLSIVPRKDEFHQTNHMLTLAKEFITNKLSEENKLGKPEQIGLLEKSIDYFKSNPSFNIDHFQETVFEQEETIQSFRDFGSRFIQKNDFDIDASFEISPSALKKQIKIYKSIIKLDKNFHIYIHGRSDLIEKGVDIDGRKYYKIYYQDEA